jgi:hypothetical protein
MFVDTTLSALSSEENVVPRGSAVFSRNQTPLPLRPVWLSVPYT